MLILFNLYYLVICAVGHVNQVKTMLFIYKIKLIKSYEGMTYEGTYCYLCIYILLKVIILSQCD